MGFYGLLAETMMSSRRRLCMPFEVSHPSNTKRCNAQNRCSDPIRGLWSRQLLCLPRATPSEELKKDIQDYVKRVTAPYKYPRIIEFVDELPKTISGKIKRAHIRKVDHGEEVQE